MTRCQLYALHAGEYVCQLAARLPEEEARRRGQTPPARIAEDTVNIAVLKGDVRATKRACKLWWSVWSNP